MVDATPLGVVRNQITCKGGLPGSNMRAEGQEAKATSLHCPNQSIMPARREGRRHSNMFQIMVSLTNFTSFHRGHTAVTGLHQLQSDGGLVLLVCILQTLVAVRMPLSQPVGRAKKVWFCRIPTPTGEQAQPPAWMSTCAVKPQMQKALVVFSREHRSTAFTSK